MCGICGYIVEKNNTTANKSRRILEQMTESLVHRGPDSGGFFFENTDEHSVGLGHRRLSIIDLSEKANQPLWNENHSILVTFNGEIYNYRELTEKLEEKGHRFKSYSDTEVIVHLYEDMGFHCIDELNGMFAFAVWDRKTSRLLLARDRIGIKPLFYAPLNGGIVFASEIKAILGHPDLKAEMEESALDTYLTFGYIPGPKTIYQGIYSLLPGHGLLWQADALQTKRYWKPDFVQSVLDDNEKVLADELDARLNEAIRGHLVADVPVGSFLSGGVDSSLVTAIAQKHYPRPLETFTIGFSGGGDERVYARLVSDHIGSNHHEQLAEINLTDVLPRLVWHLEQPLFDNSILPTYLVSNLARETGKVVLSGDGGDEPFAGYDWTRWALSLPTIPLGWDTLDWKWLYRSDVTGLLKRLAYDVGHDSDSRYLRRMTVPRIFRHWLYTPGFSKRIKGDPMQDLKNHLVSAPVRDRRERFIYSDLCNYLHEDVLFKVDRMSMAHGLEVRVPLLDHQLLEWLFRLPFRMRFQNGRGKYLLKKVAARYLPPPILKPRKQGFTVPIGRWLHGELGDTVAAIFSSRIFAERGFIRPNAAISLLKMHRSGRYDLGHRIWSIVIFEVWARIWLDGQNPSLSLLEMIKESE